MVVVMYLRTEEKSTVFYYKDHAKVEVQKSMNSGLRIVALRFDISEAFDRHWTGLFSKPLLPSQLNGVFLA